jgi:glucosamine-6-phosphate deaminase
MSSPLATSPPEHLRAFGLNGIRFFVYGTPEEMGVASAHRLANEQIRLAGIQDRVGFLVMAAPSAYPFYSAYLDLARTSDSLRSAIDRTHFFQFDDYPLPADHPASFRYLLETRFFAPLRTICPDVQFHPLDADARDPDRVCRDYTARVLDSGPDLQLKGVGENGHWGFHEPGIPLEGAAAYIRVETTEENAEQQLRDHPQLFQRPEDVPRVAFTANVPLFLHTRVSIEDNVPQASKAFALLAAYGSAQVHPAVPTSALKRHPNATVRTTAAASWALEQYAREGSFPRADLSRLVKPLGAPGEVLDAKLAYVERTLEIMAVEVTG